MRRKPFLTPEQARHVQAPLDIGSNDFPTVGEKAAARAFLTSIQDVIDKAAKESTERERLKATAKAQKRIAQENQKPWLEREISVPAGKYRDEQKMRRFADQVSIFADKQKRNAQRRNAAVREDAPAGPTQERYFRGGEGIDAVSPPVDSRGASGPRAHVVRSPVEANKHRIKERLYNAATTFLRDYDTAETGGQRLIVDLNAVGSGHAGAKSGGVVDAAREAKARIDLLKGHIGEVGWKVLEGLVAQVQSAVLGRAPTVREVGNWLSGYSGDQAQAAGVGGLIVALSFVEQFYIRENALSRGDASTAEEVRMRMQIRRERLEREREQERKRAGGKR